MRCGPARTVSVKRATESTAVSRVRRSGTEGDTRRRVRSERADDACRTSPGASRMARSAESEQTKLVIDHPELARTTDLAGEMGHRVVGGGFHVQLTCYKR